MGIEHLINRAQRREAQKALQKAALKQPVALREVAREDWPSWPANLVKVWRSRYFVVMEYTPVAGAVRLSVLRAVLGTDGNWKAAISWDDLQRVKAECGYGDRWAVELFPADASLVNVANMRHLWLLPEAPAYAWNRSAAPGAAATQKGGGSRG